MDASGDPARVEGQSGLPRAACASAAKSSNARFARLASLSNSPAASRTSRLEPVVQRRRGNTK